MTRVVAGVAVGWALTAAVAPGAWSQDPTLAVVLGRVAQYAIEYEQRFSMLVAEEDYDQRSERPMEAGNPSRTRGPSGGELAVPNNDRARRLRSDYLLVRSDEGGWFPFRDVFEVDGRRLRDRDDRLVRLLLKPSQSSSDRAQRIMAESTRYNLGRITRTINIPTLGVILLKPGLRERFAITADGTEVVAGRQAWKLAYVELARPTLVRNVTGMDLTMRGTLWVDPATGVILKTSMWVADGAMMATVTVDFREDESVDFWVPAEMTEHYRASSGSEEIRCTATYSNYRKFSVSTDEIIDKPPPPKKPGA
jgi:hypothetical protein